MLSDKEKPALGNEGNLQPFPEGLGEGKWSAKLRENATELIKVDGETGSIIGREVEISEEKGIEERGAGLQLGMSMTKDKSWRINRMHIGRRGVWVKSLNAKLCEHTESDQALCGDS